MIGIAKIGQTLFLSFHMRSSSHASGAQFVLASRAANAVTESMSICNKFSDDWKSAHMAPDSGAALQTLRRAVTKRSCCIWSPRQL